MLLQSLLLLEMATLPHRLISRYSKAKDRQFACTAFRTGRARVLVVRYDHGGSVADEACGGLCDAIVWRAMPESVECIKHTVREIRQLSW